MANKNPSPETRFKNGDKRINRDGRPKGSKDLGALFRRIGHEVATKKDGSPLLGPDGKPMTIIEAIARQWAQNPKLQAEFIDRGWGPVPDKTELSGADDGPVRIVVEYANGKRPTPDAT